MGWEACTGVVACFISVIVQAGLWVLQGCFVCHSLEPRGYQGLAFPMINIQRFTSRAKTCSAWIWIYIYLFTLFFNLFMHFFPLCSHHHPSRCLFLSACGGAIFDTALLSITRAYLCSLPVLLGCRGIQTFQENEVQSMRKK